MSSQQGSTKRGVVPPKPEDLDKGKSKQRKVRRATNKVRVKLLSIESYEKDVEFRGEGPGRVIVRLERLMGTDRIRLTDSKFMSTLLKGLEEEEHVAWLKRTYDRKKAERNRSRQLAIDGLMEPASDMQDLYNHPVFRVNRVLKRLAAFDHTMSIGQDIHPPPITPIDPFAYDDTGSIFKNYPGHNDMGMDELSELRSDNYQHLMSIIPSEQLDYLADDSEALGEDQLEEEVNEGVNVDIGGSDDNNGLKEGSSLTELQQGYGIKPGEELKHWKPFRSPLVEMVYGDDTSLATDMYKTAEEVLGVYDRESRTVDDFTIKHNRML